MTLDLGELCYYRDVKRLPWRLISDFFGVRVWQLEYYIKRRGLRFETRRAPVKHEGG